MVIHVAALYAWRCEGATCRKMGLSRGAICTVLTKPFKKTVHQYITSAGSSKVYGSSNEWLLFLISPLPLNDKTNTQLVQDG